MTPETITIAGVELRWEALTSKHYSRDERISAWSKRQPDGSTYWFASVFGEPVTGRDLPALDLAVRAALRETLDAAARLCPERDERLMSDERERCAEVCDEACRRLAESAASDRDEARATSDGALAYRSHIRIHTSAQSGTLAKRIRALGPRAKS